MRQKRIDDSPASLEQPVAQIEAVGCGLAELPNELRNPGVDRTEIWRMRQAVCTNVQNQVQKSSDEVIGGLLERRPVAVRDAGEYEPATTGMLANV